MNETIQTVMYIVCNILQSYIRYRLNHAGSVSLSLAVAQEHGSKFLHMRTKGP